MDTIIEFKKFREEKSLSLQKISKDTKISVNQLKALEEGNFDYFTNKFYAKCFYKTYAGYLGIPVKNIEVLSEDQQLQPLNLQKMSIKKCKKTKNKVSSVFLGIALILVLILFVLQYAPYILRVNNLKFLSIFSKKESPSKPLPSSIVMVKGITNKSTWIRIIIDGEIKEEATLTAGITKYWQANKSLKIRIGYVPGIDLYYRRHDNEEYQKIDITEGSFGEVNEIEFVNDPDSFQNDIEKG